jgi:hypothetical protein
MLNYVNERFGQRVSGILRYKSGEVEAVVAEKCLSILTDFTFQEPLC